MENQIKVANKRLAAGYAQASCKKLTRVQTSELVKLREDIVKFNIKAIIHFLSKHGIFGDERGLLKQYRNNERFLRRYKLFNSQNHDQMWNGVAILVVASYDELENRKSK